MLAGVVRDLEDVEGDAVDARLAQSVQAGDVRASETTKVMLEIHANIMIRTPPEDGLWI